MNPLIRELACLLRPLWPSIETGLRLQGVPVMLKVNSGHDFQSAVMGGDILGATNTGTSTTAPTATTFTTDGVNIPANQAAGHIIQRAGVYGVVLSNTSAANSVLTIDKWYDPNNPGGAAAATPAAGQWVLMPGGAPGWWMALTENSGAPASGDTTLTAELNQASGGLNRALATWSHTAGTNQFALAKTYTVNSSDVPPKTPAKMGIFNAANGGRLIFETLITSPPALVAADQMTVTDTVTI
jgi:hypothetical protein